MMYRMGLLKRGMKARELVERRRLVFYCICVLVRAAIIVTVYHWRNVRFVQLLVLIGALMGIKNLWSRNEGTQWWSKKFQLLMSVIIAVLVILVFFKVVSKTQSWLIPAAMTISLAAGILQSFVVGFC
jgi:D-alanyl-lipoteichoic acid acyltransferase DltB (MBOAT superfamily)